MRLTTERQGHCPETPWARRSASAFSSRGVANVSSLICTRPPPILERMTGADCTRPSKMIAKRDPTFTPVTFSRLSAPAESSTSKTV